MTNQAGPESFASGQSPADISKLRESLLALLGTDQVSWDALARELKTMAEQRSDASPAAQEQRRTWTLLADYLAHADQTRGVPSEVRRLLESNEAAQAAHAAFTEAMSHREEWVAFAKQLRGTRNRQSPAT